MKPLIRRNRLLAVLTALCLLVSLIPVSAFASEPIAQPCINHQQHNENDCGYTEALPEQSCTHEHTEDCYKEKQVCVHEHTDECYDDEALPATDSNAAEPVNCSHICDEETGCITLELDCGHGHDENCNFAEAVEGKDCTHSCELCVEKDSDHTVSDSTPEQKEPPTNDMGEETKKAITFHVTPDENGDTDLFWTEGEACTEDDLLQGIIAQDETGENVPVIVADLGGLDLENPKMQEDAVSSPYTVTYEAVHPTSDEIYSITRMVYVTPAIALFSDLTGGLETLTVSMNLYNGSGSKGAVWLAPQGAESGYAFYYTTGDASATPPTYGDNINTISGAAAYSTVTEVASAIDPNHDPASAESLLDLLYVQVYKVETGGNTIVGYGEATARNILEGGRIDMGKISVKRNGAEVGTFTYVCTDALYLNDYLLAGIQHNLSEEYADLLAPSSGSELATTGWYKNYSAAGDVTVNASAAAEKSNWSSVSSIATNILGCQAADGATDSGTEIKFAYKVSQNNSYEVINGSLEKSDKQVVTGLRYIAYTSTANATAAALPANANLTVNGIKLVETGAVTGNSVDGASYDTATNILTLNNYNSGAISASNMDLKLVLVGNNSVTYSSGMTAVGTNASGSNTITISGSGTLNINHTRTTGTNYGILAGGNVNINSGTVNVNMASAGYVYGIGSNTGYININVGNGASVTTTVAGGTSAAYALFASGINITGDAVLKEGDTAGGATTVTNLTLTDVTWGSAVGGTAKASKRYVSVAPGSPSDVLTAANFNELQTALQHVTNGGTIQITASFDVTARLQMPGNKSITITSGAGGPYTLTRGAGFTGSLLWLDRTCTLTLSNLILDGNKGAVAANSALIFSGGKLVMEHGTTLQNNADAAVSIGFTNTGSSIVKGQLIMNGGTIKGNGNIENLSAAILSYGDITINGGTISNNVSRLGGAIYHMGSGTTDTITINGGNILNNSAALGGAIYTRGAAVIINGGTFTGNTASDGASFLYQDNPLSAVTISPSATITCAVRGKITGTDAPNGLAATIQLTQNGSNVGSQMTANADGTFVIPDVPRGEKYRLTVSMTGYTTGATSEFAIEYDDARDMNLSLAKEGQPATQYTISVSASPADGGTVNGGGTFNANTSLTVTAVANSNYEFVKWTENGTQVSTSASYTFTLTGNRNLVAVFNYTGGNGGGGGSSSGGSSGSQVTITTPFPEQPNPPTEGVIKPTVSVDKDGTVKVDVSDQDIQNAIDKALQQAKKGGTEGNGIAVCIDLTGIKTEFNTLPLTLSKSAYEKLVNAGVKYISIRTPQISLALDLETLKTIHAAADGDVTINAVKSDAAKLPGELSGRSAYDITITSGGKTISQMGGYIAIILPYTLQGGEQGGNLQMAYVGADGKLYYITDSSYDADAKALLGRTNHLTVFGIANKPTPAFTDIENHWAKDDILFVASRGLLSGTGNNQFSPDTGMTRGMFVTALGRLAGINSTKYQNSKFTDVAATAYYAPYVAWAADKGIVNGTTATTFAPEQAVTRQQMAVIMTNYAKAMGYTVPKTRETVTFADSASIASWAKGAVKAMQMAGVLNGKDGNRFDPQASATRAEVSAVLRRFVEIIIDPATAQGLDKNDSGSAMLYENGRLVKSASRTVGTSTYSFNSFGEAALPVSDKKYLTHVVKKNEYFYSISRLYGCRPEDIMALNGLEMGDMLHPGDKLKIPEK